MLKIDKDGTLIFDDEDEMNVKTLQKIIPPDDIYLFALLYMQSLDELVSHMGEEYKEVLEEVLSDIPDTVLTAFSCCDLMDCVYSDWLILTQVIHHNAQAVKPTKTA